MTKGKNWPSDTQAAQTIKVFKGAAKRIITHIVSNGKDARKTKGK